MTRGKLIPQIQWKDMQSPGDAGQQRMNTEEGIGRKAKGPRKAAD